MNGEGPVDTDAAQGISLRVSSCCRPAAENERTVHRCPFVSCLLAKCVSHMSNALQHHVEYIGVDRDHFHSLALE